MSGLLLLALVAKWRGQWQGVLQARHDTYLWFWFKGIRSRLIAIRYLDITQCIYGDRACCAAALATDHEIISAIGNVAIHVHADTDTTA
jgi:hypothetical protein